MRTKVKVVKNKLAPPFREAEFDVIYGEGISKSGTVLDAGVEQNVVEKSGHLVHATRTSASARAARTPRSGCRRTRRSSPISRPRFARRSGSGRRRR